MYNTLSIHAATVRVNGRELPIQDSRPMYVTGYDQPYAYRADGKIIVHYTYDPSHREPDIAKKIKDAYAALERVRNLWSKAHATR